MKKYKISIIGLGHQSLKDQIPATLDSEMAVLDSVYDINAELTQTISKQYSVNGYNSINDLIKFSKPDIAIVCVPHSQYAEIIDILCKEGIHIIKEKPFSISIEEANKYNSLLKKHNVKMLVSVQRRFHPIYQTLEKIKSKVGRVFSIRAEYAINVKRLDQGWRASLAISGGGALVDMGYHYIDLLIWYFGLPDTLNANISFGNREGQVYDVEDTASINFEYFDPITNHRSIGNLYVTRVSYAKEESLTIIGSRGCIKLIRGKISRYDLNGNLVESLEREHQWLSAFTEQIETLIYAIQADTHDFENSYLHHFKHLAFIESAYKSQQKNKVISPIDTYRKIMPNHISN